MPDSSDIDNAIVAMLSADAALLALCPNGVYIDEAPPGFTRFVIVSLADEHDEPMQGGRAYEDALYLIEARVMSKSGTSTDAKDAFARIEALLEDQPLLVAGYVWMLTRRESRLPVRTEVDAVDPSIRWHRRGAHFRAVMSL